MELESKTKDELWFQKLSLNDILNGHKPTPRYRQDE